MHCSLLTNAQNSNPCQVRTLTLATEVKENERRMDESAGHQAGGGRWRTASIL